MALNKKKVKQHSIISVPAGQSCIKYSSDTLKGKKEIILDKYLKSILSIYVINVIIIKPTSYAYLIPFVAIKTNNNGKRSCLNDENSETLEDQQSFFTILQDS